MWSSLGCWKRNWRLMFPCMLAQARSEHTEQYCWPEFLIFFMERSTKIPSSSTCLTMSCLTLKISSGRQCVYIYVDCQLVKQIEHFYCLRMSLLSRSVVISPVFPKVAPILTFVIVHVGLFLFSKRIRELLYKLNTFSTIE